MIINKERDNIQVLGDIKQIKTSIDPKNLEFITTLLSSNLYSNPEQSFIREIVSNAWDSHVVAKTTDTPVIIRFKRNNGSWEITIRDFGTGLSQEKFEDLYCNIGSSTKRETNELLGGFGIGRYASLACSDTVYVNSYYEGTVYMYVIVKSGNSITTNFVLQKPTEEKNGIEVTIKNKTYIQPYQKALDSIVFFPNIYIDGIYNTINDTKIKKFNNFAVASISVEDKILLGNVLYPCKLKDLSSEAVKFLRSIQFSGIVIKFNIGELSVTPNRENIIYNTETVQVIEKRILEAKKELDELATAKFCKDYTDLNEFYKINSHSVIYSPLTDDWHTYGFKSDGYITKVDVNNCTFNGTKDINDSMPFVRIFFNSRIPNFKGVIHDYKFYCGDNIPYKVKKLASPESKKIIILKGINRLSAAAKEWLKERYNDYIVTMDISEKEFKTAIAYSIPDLSSYPKKDLLVNYMYKYIITKALVLDLKNNKDFLEYKKELKESKKDPVLTVKNFIVYKQDPCYRSSYTFKDINDCIKHFNKVHRGVILTDMQAPSFWGDVAAAKNFIFVRARKDIVKALYEVHPSWLVDKDKLLKEDSTIRKVHTILQYFSSDSIPSRFDYYEMLNSVPDSLREQFKALMTFFSKYRDNSTYLSLAAKDDIKIDSYTAKICKQLRSYVRMYDALEKDLGLKARGTTSLDGTLLAAVIMKNKIYRISSQSYNKVRNNKLLRILCRK